MDRLIASAVLLLLPARVFAADANAIRVEHSDEGCVSKPTFENALLEQSPKTEINEKSDLTITIHVRKNDRIFGSVSIAQGGTSVGEPREISGESCESVIAALALTAALMLNPDFTDAQPIVVPAEKEKELPLPHKPASSWKHALSYEVLFNHGISENGIFGIRLSYEARPSATTAFRIGAEGGWSIVDTLSHLLDVGAYFTPLLAHVEGCAFRLSGEGTSVIPCLRARTGAVLVQGFGATVNPATVTPWLDLSPVLRGEIGSGFHTTFVELSAMIPITRPRFTMYDIPGGFLATSRNGAEVLIHQPPVIGFEISVGGTLHL